MFGQLLKVQVNDADGNPVPNALVTFVAPVSGASAVISPSSVMTDMGGQAGVSATANAIVGSYEVTANVDGAAIPAVFELTNTIDTSDVIFADGFE